MNLVCLDLNSRVQSGIENLWCPQLKGEVRRTIRKHNAFVKNDGPFWSMTTKIRLILNAVLDEVGIPNSIKQDVMHHIQNHFHGCYIDEIKCSYSVASWNRNITILQVTFLPGHFR